MILSDHISFTDDGHAWLIVPDENVLRDSVFSSRSFVSDADRPCDTCGGWDELEENHPTWGAAMGADCPDCLGGRHTFAIETECDEPDVRRYADQGWHDGPTCNQCGCVDGVLERRVSVVPGMILPIYNIFGVGPEVDRSVPHMMMDETGAWYLDGDGGIRAIVLPSAAVPGMWAVNLKVLS